MDNTDKAGEYVMASPEHIHVFVAGVGMANLKEKLDRINMMNRIF